MLEVIPVNGNFAENKTKRSNNILDFPREETVFFLQSLYVMYIYNTYISSEIMHSSTSSLLQLKIKLYLAYLNFNIK